MKTIEEQLGDATKSHLAKVEDRPDFLGTRLETNGNRHSIIVIVRDIEAAIKDGIRDLVRSPINVTLEDGAAYSLRVDFEEGEEFVLGL